MQNNLNGNENRKIGGAYEEMAAAFLHKKGYCILDRNVHCKQGEVDIIALDGNVYVFVEVKYRKSISHGDPMEMVPYTKQRKICKAALYYLMKKGLGEDTPCRFDIIGIYGDGQIRQIENAFPYVR